MKDERYKPVVHSEIETWTKTVLDDMSAEQTETSDG